MLTGLFFGSRAPLPSGDALVNTLKDGARGATAGHNRLRSLLVVGQVAISVPLLVGAGLAVRSLYNLSRVDTGLDTTRVLAANVNLNWSRYNDGQKRYDFWTRAMLEAEKIPSVQSVAVAGAEPLSGNVANRAANFIIERQQLPPGSPTPFAVALVSTEKYFSVVGQPLLRGRFFLATDTGATQPVAIINQSLASRYWPHDDPIGQRISFDNGTTWITIVGLVANARQQLDTDAQDEIHVAFTSASGTNSATLLIRTSAAPETLTRELREAFRRADPQQPVTRIESIEQQRANALASPKLIATLLGLFAVLALVITAAGIGGVLAFSVSQRTQEIGIRMALGASRGDVLRMVLRQGLALVAVGFVVGTTAAFFLSQLMGTLLYGVPPTDPLTFAAVAGVLFTVAAFACFVPARRATTIDPLVALHTT